MDKAKNKTVYIVISSFGEFESETYERIWGVYETKNAAKLAKDDIDSFYQRMQSNPSLIFDIIPENIYNDWPWDEDKNDYVKKYKGYTKVQREVQEERLGLLEYEYIETKIVETQYNPSKIFYKQ